MRHTWHQIQQMYPDQWVLIKDLEMVKGNLISGVVIHTCKDRWDINRFTDESPEDVQCMTYVRYTGDIIEGESEYNDEDVYVDVGLTNVF